MLRPKNGAPRTMSSKVQIGGVILNSQPRIHSKFFSFSNKLLLQFPTTHYNASSTLIDLQLHQLSTPRPASPHAIAPVVLTPFPLNSQRVTLSQTPKSHNALHTTMPSTLLPPSIHYHHQSFSRDVRDGGPNPEGLDGVHMT